MFRWRNIIQVFGGIVFIGLVAPQMVSAQGERTMEFGVDDVEKGDERNTQKQLENEKKPAVSFDGLSAAVLAETKGMNRKRRLQLQRQLEKLIGELDLELETKSSQTLLKRLEKEAADGCSRDPICLADVGRQIGVAEILLVRAERPKKGGDWTLTVDRFDVRQRLFTDYDERTGLQSWSALKKNLEPSVRTTFGLEAVKRTSPNIKKEGGANVQRILAWTTGGLALVALGGGAYYGWDVQKEVDRLEQQRTDGNYTLTQREADRRQRNLEKRARNANIFYGVAAGLAVTSGVLFIVESGSDVAQPSSDRRRRAGGLRIVPSVGKEHWGFGAVLTF